MMGLGRSSALAAALLVSPAAFGEESRPLIPDDIGARVADNFIAPNLADFTAQSNTMSDAIATLCADPGGDALNAARAEFGSAVDAWGRVSVLRFGPLQSDARFERVFFWPDPRGVMLRQVQALLAEDAMGTLDAAALAQKSVAVQGMPALEFVLFGAGSDDLATGKGAALCNYAAAIASNIADIAESVERDWAENAPYRENFIRPAADGDPFRSTEEVAGEVVKALATGLQFVVAAELEPPLGESVDKANGRRAPFWRSGLTFRFVAAQADAVVDLLAATGLEAGLPGDRAAIVASVRFDVEHARDALGRIGEAPETAFRDEKDRGVIAYVVVALHGANHAVNDQLTEAIGLVMGFNALDGD